MKELPPGAVSRYFKHYALYFWTTVWILVGLLLGMLILCFTGDARQINIGVVLIWMLAFFLLGALVGCLFGVPKAVSDPLKNFAQRSAVQPSGTPNTIDTDKAVTAAKGITNLTDISDWLTKIVVGAGLTQLQNMPKYIMHVANKMAEGIDLTSKANSNILCAGILVYYTCFGLIAGYFVMRSIFKDII
jgi:hypothetical protein